MSRTYIDPYSGKRKSMRHANQQRHKRRQIAMIDAVGRWYLAPVSWSEYDYSDLFWNPSRGPAEGAYPVENSRPRCFKYYRTRCNRQLRRKKDVYWGNGNSYRRVTEFWWTVT
jgi:hypothetical protein